MVEGHEYTIDQAIHEELPTTLPLLPLKNVVLLPKSITPIIVGRASSIRAVEAALKADRMVFISTQKQADIESPTYQDVYPDGTRAVILQVMRMPNGSVKILAEGLCRATIERVDYAEIFDRD